MTLSVFTWKGADSVIEAKDGYAGLKAFAQASFDLVITDIFMPDQDGIETIRMLRKLQPTIKIIAISGGIVGDRIYLREAKALGADSVLPKPFRRKDLLNLVNACLVSGPCS